MAGLLRLSSETTHPSDLNRLEGSCPCPGPWAWAHGAHLVIQVEGIEPLSTVLAAPPPFPRSGVAFGGLEPYKAL